MFTPRGSQVRVLFRPTLSQFGSVLFGRVALDCWSWYARSVERVLRIAETYEVAEEIDLRDWLALSGRERLEIGERMRREAWPDHEPGLQRLLRVVEPTRR